MTKKSKNLDEFKMGDFIPTYISKSGVKVGHQKDHFSTSDLPDAGPVKDKPLNFAMFTSSLVNSILVVFDYE